MANTKHSAAREIIIDRLLRNRRGYSIQELLEIINRSLEMDGFRPVTANTIRNDIRNIMYGYKLKVHVEKRGFREYFMYEDPESTIYNGVLTFGELAHLHSALLSIRYQDEMQGSLMYQQLSERLCGLLDFESISEPILIYERIPVQQELDVFQSLYENIRTKTPVYVDYKKSSKDKGLRVLIHPYYLRQRGYKWYLLGHDATNGKSVDVYIGEFSHVTAANEVEYIPNSEFQLNDYYTKHISYEQ